MVLIQKIISKHIIKPSVPTPKEFKTHKLSYLEQIAPEIYIISIFCYQNDESKPYTEISERLKQSLSQVLTDFYPFAGVLKENSYVDCDDSGVEFTETQVNARLEDVIKNPELEDFRQLYPKDCTCHSDNDILLVRVNFLECGGIVVGVCLSHKVADASSSVEFVNAWAATCYGEPKTIKPLFDSALHFPPRDMTPICFAPKNEKFITKRLVFDREKIEKIKSDAASVALPNPSRVEALSVFFWQQFIQIMTGTSGMQRSSVAIAHTVNLRPRTIPPMPDHLIGSNSIVCFAFPGKKTTNASDLMLELRATFKGIDDTYIKKFVNSEEYLRMIFEHEELFNSSAKVICLVSIWRLPVYNVNFGWGRPAFAHMGVPPYNNHLFLESTPSGDGIEIWINTSEDFFQMIESNYTKLFN